MTLNRDLPHSLVNLFINPGDTYGLNTALFFKERIVYHASHVGCHERILIIYHFLYRTWLYSLESNKYLIIELD